MMERRLRWTKVGGGVWLLTALAYSIWYVTSSDAQESAEWLRGSVGLIVMGLGVWVLALVLVRRGRFPYAGIAIGSLFVAFNVIADTLAAWPADGMLEGHLIESLPTYAAIILLCHFFDRLIRKAKGR